MRELVPRQSGSVGASGSSSVSIASPASGSIDTSVSQTSGFTTATAATTAVFSSQPSSTPFSDFATTTPTTTETTSTPQTTTSDSSSTSPTHVSSTPTPTSSHSTSSQLTSITSTSTAQSSTSAPPSSTTPPPTSSSSLETQSTITSTYTTYENGTPVVATTAIATTIPLVTEPTSSSERTAIIAGSAAGGTALLILFLSLAFFARRKRFKRLDFLDAITYKRKQARTRESFLAGEDLDDVNLARPPLRYANYDTPWDGSTRALMVGREANSGPGTPGENLWPPPHEGTHLMDPLANRDDLDLDLGRIVDDVMGPTDNVAAVHFTDRSVSSMYRGSMADSDGMHSRTVSSSSNAALLDAAGLGGTMTAPVRSSPLAQQETTPHSAENAS
ncbi:hypothetical protein JVU11DRAFT_8631 [Chiua virens]|nr:hypothetical protein JVU11DRAFT_8631 [Chiua virens]